MKTLSKQKSGHKRLLTGIIGLALIMLALAYTLPWKKLLEEKLKSEIAARGISNLEFTVKSVGVEKITFSDIVFGELKLPELSISYNLRELWHGNFREIHAADINLKAGQVDIILKDVDTSLVTNTWEIKTINVAGAPVALPPLSGKGKVEFTDNKLLLSGDIASADKKTSGRFIFNYSVGDEKSANVKISSVSMPWSGGVVSAQNISIPVYSKNPISLNLKIKKVPLNTLLAAATANRATATGVVSGTLPVVINRDGSFTVKKGDLKAEDKGKIMLSPDVIPSDTPQVALLRDVLKDFHYVIFSMGIESANDKQLSMLLSLEGNNPDVYNGRVVKLNVHLSGDVIDLVTRSINIINNPDYLTK
jgi:hypothetical protein